MHKSQIIISCIILCLIASVSAVSATDMNDTQYGENNDLLAIDSANENLTVNNQMDEILSNENSEILGASEGTFDELRSLLEGSPSSPISLQKNYVFSAGDVSNHIKISAENLEINGNGHIIDAKGQTSIFEITSNNVVLKNIQLKNAYKQGENGAAILWKGDNGVVETCIFVNNTVSLDQNGGAIYWTGKNAKIKNSNFTNNNALKYESSGGAVYFSTSCQIVSVTDSTFDNNNASKYGGAIYIERTKSDVIGCTFNNNYVTSGGGAAIYYRNYADHVNVSDCIFKDNNAKSEAGSAIYAVSVNSTINNCQFDGTDQLYLYSEEDNAVINVTNNKEVNGVYDGFIIKNDARLYLENNSFKNSIYNSKTILSPVKNVMSIAGRPMKYDDSPIYYYDKPSQITVIIQLKDDKGNVIVCDNLKFNDSKEGIKNLSGRFYRNSTANFLTYKMNFVGQHNLSLYDDANQFENLKNYVTRVRVSGSYDDLKWLSHYYWSISPSETVIVEGHITYDPDVDVTKEFYVYQNFTGRLWGGDGRVEISGNDMTNGFVVDISSKNCILDNFELRQMSNKTTTTADSGGASIVCSSGMDIKIDFTVKNCIIGSGPCREDDGDYKSYTTYQGTAIRYIASNLTLINCEVRGSNLEKSSLIYSSGNNIKIINTSFHSAGVNGACVEITRENTNFRGNNVLLENITFLDKIVMYKGIYIEKYDNIKISGLTNTNLFKPGTVLGHLVVDSVLFIKNSENILVDRVIIRAFGDLSEIQTEGVYNWNPVPLMVFQVPKMDSDVYMPQLINNLTISDCEYWNGLNVFIYLNSSLNIFDKNANPYYIHANISNVYCHDLSRQLLRVPGYDTLNGDRYNAADPLIYQTIACTVNLTNSKFWNNDNGPAIWGLGPLYVSNCSFINNTGYFDPKGKHVSGISDNPLESRYWYGESGAAIAASDYLECKNSTFINNYNCLGDRVDGLNYGGGAISSRSYCIMAGSSIGAMSSGWYGIVDNCTFINNTATNGGAIQITGQTIINNSNFVNNSAKVFEGDDYGDWFYANNRKDYSGDSQWNHVLTHHIMIGMGGALFILEGNANVNNCTFDDNMAYVSGAAIGSASCSGEVYLSMYDDRKGVTADLSSSELIINGSTFTNNHLNNESCKGHGTTLPDNYFTITNPNKDNVYPDVIHSQVGYTNITNNIFDNYDHVSMLINSSYDVYIENNTEINNKTNRTFDSYNGIYSVVLLNGRDYFSNNNFNNSIFFVYGEPIYDNHEFMSHVTITYMENKTYYIMIDNEGWINLTATIFDDNNNIIVSNTGFLFTDNYTSIKTYQNTDIVSYNYDGWYHNEYDEYENIVYHNYDGVYWNYTHMTLPIRGYKVIPKNTTLGKFNNSTIAFGNYEVEYNNRIIHDFRNATVYNATLIKMPYCYTWLQQQLDKAQTVLAEFNGAVWAYNAGGSFDDRLIQAQFHGSFIDERTGEEHIVFNLIHNITFFPDYDLWDGNGYKDVINFTNGVLLNKSITINGYSEYSKDFNFGISHSSAAADSFTFTISGDNQARIFNITNANINMDRVNFINSTSDYDGGALHVTKSNVTLNDVSFSNSTSNSSGGAIFLNDSKLSGSMTFYNHTASNYGGLIYSQDSTINLNIKSIKSSAYSGGAFYLNNSILNSETSSFRDSIALNGSGGVIYAIGNQTVINGSFGFGYCNANISGGAIYANNIKPSKVTISSVESTANISGGVIHVENSNMTFDTFILPSDHVDVILGEKVNEGDHNFYFTGEFLSLNWANLYGGVISAVNSNITVSGSYHNNGHNNGNYTAYGGVIYLNNSNAIIKSMDAYKNIATFGGLIYSDNLSNCSVINSSLIKNQAQNDGGMIYFYNSYSLNIIGSIIGTSNGDNYYGGNSAISGNGGALYLVNVSCVDIVDSSFDSNYASNNGGALSLVNVSHINISSSSFNSNYASNNGGALSLVNVSHINISSSSFNSNSANNDSGGALYAISISDNLNIWNSTFTNNNANNGGAIFMTNCTGNESIVSSSFSSNHAINGGAVCLVDIHNIDISTNNFGYFDTSLSEDGDGFISTASIKSKYGNYADNGGAIFMQNAGDVTLFRNIFTLNQAKNGGASFLNNVSKINFTRNYFGGLAPFDGYKLDNITFNRMILNFNNITKYIYEGNGWKLSGSSSSSWQWSHISNVTDDYYEDTYYYNNYTFNIPNEIFQYSYLNVTHYLNWFSLSGNSAQNGGGLYITNSLDIDIIGNQFNDCNATEGYGGAIFLENVSNINISSNHFGDFSSDFDYNDYNYTYYYKYNNIFNMIFNNYNVPYNNFQNSTYLYNIISMMVIIRVILLEVINILLQVSIISHMSIEI